MKQIIDRPIFAIIFLLVVILLGFVSFMKSPPIQYTDDVAREKTEAYIAGE